MTGMERHAKAAAIVEAAEARKAENVVALDVREVSSFADYEKKLRKAKVILDREERKKIITKQATKLGDAEGLTVKDDPALLDELAGLAEWPVVLMGRVDNAFMDLPPEVLTTAMRHHQKYFFYAHQCSPD